MSDSNINSDENQEVLENIYQSFQKRVENADEEELKNYIEERVLEFLEYDVKDEDQIEEYIEKDIEEDLGVSIPVEEEKDPEEVSFFDIEEVVSGESPGRVSVQGEVVDLWDSSDSINSVGLISDGTDTIKFLVWSLDDERDTKVQEGGKYEMKNVSVQEYQGDKEVQAKNFSKLQEIEEDFELDQSEEINGTIVKIYDRSGLIKRDEDGQVIDGSKEGENDLRIKMVVDDGQETYSVVANREVTEEITGITLQKAIDMARDQLDRKVVLNEIKDQLMLQQVNVKGVKRGDYIMSEDIMVGQLPSSDDVEVLASEVLMKVRGDNNE